MTDLLKAKRRKATFHTEKAKAPTPKTHNPQKPPEAAALMKKRTMDSIQ